MRCTSAAISACVKPEKNAGEIGGAAIAEIQLTHDGRDDSESDLEDALIFGDHFLFPAGDVRVLIIDDEGELDPARAGRSDLLSPNDFACSEGRHYTGICVSS